MPYIEPGQRMPLDPLIEKLADALPNEQFAGQLNYAISKLSSHLLRKKLSYARVNEIVGALECAKLELYRRVAAPYEDSKIDQNGDVF
ncbi:MAG: hypothetical protein KDB90_00690 [Planctomycetes bacterium]|nr:hypothetical protein [Planctomycetota bacterium]